MCWVTGCATRSTRGCASAAEGDAMKTISLLFAALAAAGCAASPYGAPYSIIEVERVRQADAHVIPLIVNRVDDVTSEHNRYMVVAPGRHLVTVDVPPR